MDLHGIKAIDDSRSPRELQPRPQQPPGQEPAPSASAPTAPPDAEGVLAPSRDEQAQTRDAAERQTPDHSARLAEKMREFATAAHMPANTRLTIEYDADSGSTRFVVREKDSGEVIREIPDRESEEILDSLSESSGFLVDESF